MVKFKLLDPRAEIPSRGSERAVGLDLFAIEKTELKSHTCIWVSTGIAVDLGSQWAAIMPRSGMFGKGIIGHAGTIDPDYRGELKVGLYNTNPYPYMVEPGDRVGQLVVHPKQFKHSIGVFADLERTERGSGGFGSTGR